jgi:hypothetical protein
LITLEQHRMSVENTVFPIASGKQAAPCKKMD